MVCVFFLATIVVILAGCPPYAPPPPDDTNTGGAADSVIAAIEQRAHDLVNIERANNGLPALAMNSDVRAVARAHSEDMAANNYFSHTNLDDESPFDRLDKAGVPWRTAGENIGYNSGYADPAAVAVDSWMNSDGHRANILTEAFTHAGMGVGRAPDGAYYFTQVFIGN